MSRSYLRSKYMKSCWVSNTKNPHHYDEVSKNYKTSRFVETRCPGAWAFKQTGSRQGHQVRNEGHRIASGIIRAKVKKETNQEILFSLSIADESAKRTEM